MSKRCPIRRPAVLALLALTVTAPAGGARPVSWPRCLRQRDAWYAGAEAVRVADNVLLYQRDSGGWPKNIDMARTLSDKETAALKRAKARTDATLDNGATHTQMRYLARVYTAAKHERFKAAFLQAMDYLLAAQYPNGGWPQRWPNPKGYSRHITFNDGAMIGAMKILRGIAAGQPPYAFVDQARRKKADRAVIKGIDCILKCQIVVAGHRTAWCAQHDEKTLAPRPARTYEKASISGGESVGVVAFLMDIDKPSPQVIEAVQAAVAWFDRAKLMGIRQVTQADPGKPGGRDKVIVKDPAARPLWARFHEIGTNRPIFCSRDGVVRYRLSEISHERRNGYAWYGAWPASLLAKRYPAWQQKHAPGRNVLGRAPAGRKGAPQKGRTPT